MQIYSGNTGRVTHKNSRLKKKKDLIASPMGFFFGIKKVHKPNVCHQFCTFTSTNILTAEMLNIKVIDEHSTRRQFH